jgi:hypothetical protein
MSDHVYEFVLRSPHGERVFPVIPKGSGRPPFEAAQAFEKKAANEEVFVQMAGAGCRMRVLHAGTE